MKQALITGADGFVGRSMATFLETNGWHVHGVDITFGADVMKGFMQTASTSYDLVVHAAAAGPNRRAIDTQPANFPYNTMLDAAMFDWAIRTKQRRVVYLSSSAVYSDGLHREPFNERDGFVDEPFDSYGAAKRHGERMAEHARYAGVNVTVVRPFSGYGSSQSEDFPFGAFVGRAHRREDPFTIWGDANQVRDWIHITDITRAIMALVEHNVDVPVNLCTGRGVSMYDLAMLCHQAVGYAPHIDVDPAAPMGVMYRVGDPTRLHDYYEPKITIEEGVERALKL